MSNMMSRRKNNNEEFALKEWEKEKWEPDLTDGERAIKNLWLKVKIGKGNSLLWMNGKIAP